MKIISHRGNLNGPDPERENSLKAISECLEINIDVEVDIWFKDNCFFLGHDFPEIELDPSYFNNDKIWFHLKNIECLEHIKIHNPKHYFWHENDTCTITSCGKFWFYPGSFISSNNAIFVMPELHTDKDNLLKLNNYAICTDYVKIYQ